MLDRLADRGAESGYIGSQESKKGLQEETHPGPLIWVQLLAKCVVRDNGRAGNSCKYLGVGRISGCGYVAGIEKRGVYIRQQMFAMNHDEPKVATSIATVSREV